MRRKVVVTVSAMIVAAQLGSPLFAAQPTVAQLGQIAGYLEANDVDGLRGYLDANPDLTEGDTTLARLLRQFLSESADVTTYLGFLLLTDEYDRAGQPAPPPIPPAK